MQHLDEGTIHAWLDDALPASEAAAVEAHVARCAECAALVAEARGLIAGSSRIVSSLDHVPAGVIPTPQPKPQSLWHTLRFTPARASIAALVLIGVASMFTARRVELKGHAVASTGHPERSEVPLSPAPGHPESSEGPRSVASHPEPSEGPRSVASHPEPSKGPRPVASHPERSEGPLSSAANSTATPPSPEPQPKVTAKREAVAPASAGIAASKSSLEVAAADTPRVQRDTIRAERNFAASAPMALRRMVPVFDTSTPSPAGCYRLLVDSSRAIAMPERFALQRDSVGRNVVLRLSAENRPDSVLSGFAWRLVSPTVARLTAPGAELVLTTTVSGRGRLGDINGSADVPLLRTTCRP